MIPGFKKNSGDVLLSHPASQAVPSALKSLTSVFGMGTGVTSSLSPPKKRYILIVYNLSIILKKLPLRSNRDQANCNTYFVAKPHDRLVPVS